MASSRSGKAKKVTRKEPIATPEEFKRRVIRQVDLPATELVKGSNSRLVVGQEIMISFLKMDAGSYFAPHKHVQEQIMIVMDGYCDEIIEGKIYRVTKGDVIILPSNVEHGAYIGHEDCYAIDIFSSVRGDYLLKMLQLMVDLNPNK